MCFTEPSFMRVVEHAIYVVVESVVLILLALRARADFATAEELMRIVEQIQGDNGTINLNASHLAVKGRVSRKLVDALQHIETAIQQVHRSSDAIRQASGDIAHGNQLLSSRTEDAAAASRKPPPRWKRSPPPSAPAWTTPIRPTSSPRTPPMWRPRAGRWCARSWTR